jgi:hypothetical protein
VENAKAEPVEIGVKVRDIIDVDMDGDIAPGISRAHASRSSVFCLCASGCRWQ